MRALCGAVITAGSLIGLGLTAMAYALRFANSPLTHESLGKDTSPLLGTPSMVLVLVVLIICAGIGLAITFLGLMYHHERRYHELRRHMDNMATTSATPSRVDLP